MQQDRLPALEIDTAIFNPFQAPADLRSDRTASPLQFHPATPTTHGIQHVSSDNSRLTGRTYHTFQ